MQKKCKCNKFSKALLANLPVKIVSHNNKNIIISIYLSTNFKYWVGTGSPNLLCLGFTKKLKPKIYRLINYM